MGLSEYEVGLPVPAPAVPPSFHNAFVISIDLVVGVGLPVWEGLCDNDSQKEETDCLCPSNIPPVCLPSW
jgi:hypothetical protein